MNGGRLPTEEQLDQLIDQFSNAILAVHEFKQLIKPLRSFYYDPNDPTPKQYVSVICAAFEVDPIILKVKNNKRSVVYIRHCIFYLLYEHFWITKKATQKQIGDAIGRDRTTMLHSHASAKDLIETKDGIFMPYYEKAINAINHYLIIKQQKNEQQIKTKETSDGN